ncbi:condensation domain-containing protein, partial [Mycobacterium simulans]|uniref:condensation domain-containing protein n=1 Tax=Mycobacterium simulans TaxID=627089 RepID=UPI0021E526B9
MDIWLSQETVGSQADWQVGWFVPIKGVVDPDVIDRAIRQVVDEAEPLRVVFCEVDGEVFQRAIDDPDVGVARHDLRHSQNPVRDAYELALSIQCAPLSWPGPLYKFALFQTRSDEFHLYICSHHIVLDGFGTVLITQRISAVYSALISGNQVPAAVFGSLRDLVDYESEYEKSGEYLEDRAYWCENLPAENGPTYQWPQVVNRPDFYPASTPIQLDPAVVNRVDELCEVLGVRRSSVITAACALLVREWCAGGSDVALDFPVSRRISAQSKTVPGMVSGFVPLALRALPSSTVADFCEHVESQIRDALRHQRFPVHVLENNRGARAAGQETARVAINFVPATTILPFGSAPASIAYTSFGRVNHFGLYFIKDGDQLSLVTAGVGRPFSDFDVSDLAQRLQRLLVALVADPQRRLSSVEVLDEAERAQLDAIGNRGVLAGVGPGASLFHHLRRRRVRL